MTTFKQMKGAAATTKTDIPTIDMTIPQVYPLIITFDDRLILLQLEMNSNHPIP